MTGANVDTFIDFDHPESPIAFRWSRYYTSADVGREGPVGRGFRHSYERSLAVDLDRVVYTDAEGRTFEFPPVAPGALPSSRDG